MVCIPDEQKRVTVVPEVVTVEGVSDEEMEALTGGKAAEGQMPSEKVSFEEHVRRMLAEGAATSIVLEDFNRRPT